MAKKFLKYIFILSLLILPFEVMAEMRSSSYVIFENVLHSFDGPIISNVNSAVNGNSVTITWNTNVIADAFVVYDITNPFNSSKEQGTSVKNSTNHSVAMNGLAYNTTYYYRVRSERINGGITTDNIVRSFTTENEPVIPAQPAAGGGGIIVIDKTDKIAPVISDVSASDITSDSARISWKTDERATSFVEYGQGTNFGSTYGRWSSTMNHVVIIDALRPDTRFNFRVLSSDAWGNVGRGSILEFMTLPDVSIQEEESMVTPAPPEETSIAREATRRAMEFLGRIFPEAPLAQIGAERLLNVGSLREFVGFLPSPVISGEPRVTVSATQAVIFWTTDVEASSQVAVAPSESYRPGAIEPYREIVGNAEEAVKEHEVTIYGLSPDTEYHFQIRSKAGVGPIARSRDYTFRTSIEELSITSFFSQIVDEQTAIFKWVTNKEADSIIRFSPYQDNVIAIDEAKTVSDSQRTIIHELKISEFQPGVFYDVELISVDEKGNLAFKKLERFATAKDDLPPEVSHIKADSTVFLDQGDKIQTIISWLTNEPSTSRIYYSEGVVTGNAEMAESTNLNTNYTKEHVIVITKFKPGVVYSFRVESIDSGGNATLSPVHTFMTAKKRESIIQIIIRILEQTFGWTKKLM